MTAACLAIMAAMVVLAHGRETRERGEQGSR